MQQRGLGLLALSIAAACGSTQSAPSAAPAATEDPLTPLAAIDEDARRFSLDGVTVELAADGRVSVGDRWLETRLPDEGWSVTDAAAMDVTGDGLREIVLQVEADGAENEEDDGSESGVWSSSAVSWRASALVVIEPRRPEVWSVLTGRTYEMAGDSSTEGESVVRDELACEGDALIDGPRSWEIECTRCAIDASRGRHPSAEAECERSSTRHRIAFAIGDPPLRSTEPVADADAECACPEMASPDAR